MTEQEVELIKRISYLEYKLEVVFNKVKESDKKLAKMSKKMKAMSIMLDALDKVEIAQTELKTLKKIYSESLTQNNKV